MLLTNLDLPPPIAIESIAWIPPKRLWLTVRKDTQVYLLEYPKDRLLDWLGWRSTLYRARYYERYVVSYVEVLNAEYNEFAKSNRIRCAIHMQWIASHYNANRVDWLQIH